MDSTAELIAMFSPRSWVTPAWVVAQLAEPFVAASLRTVEKLIGLPLDVESRALRACLDDGLTGHLIEVAACAGLYDKLRAHGVRPTLVTGHSVGIYTALAATGGASLEALLELLANDIARFRATTGILATVTNVAVGEVEEECARTGEAWVSAYNGERLCTVSGAQWAVAHIETWARQREGKLRRCDGFGPHHSPMIRPLRPVMERETAAAVRRDPEVPIAFPLSPLRIEATRQGVIAAAIDQLMAPVRWTQLVTALLAPPGAVAVEVGTGNVIHRLFQSTPRERAQLRTVADCLAGRPQLPGRPQPPAQAVFTAARVGGP